MLWKECTVSTSLMLPQSICQSHAPLSPYSWKRPQNTWTTQSGVVTCPGQGLGTSTFSGWESWSWPWMSFHSPTSHWRTVHCFSASRSPPLDEANRNTAKSKDKILRPPKWKPSTTGTRLFCTKKPNQTVQNRPFPIIVFSKSTKQVDCLCKLPCTLEYPCGDKELIQCWKPHCCSCV